MTPDQIAQLKRRAADGYMFRGAATVLALIARIEALEAGLKPFAAVANINAPLAAGWSDRKPNSEFIPGVWPNWGDFRRAANLLGDRHD